MYTLFTTVYCMDIARPCHHACAVQRWRHHLTARVKASGEQYKQTMCLGQTENCFRLNLRVYVNNNVTF